MNLEIDIGPLSWVKEEIELALDRAIGLLQKYAGRQDATLLAEARSHLHQAHGALAIVGLDGVTEFSRAIERLLDALTESKLVWSPTIGEAAQEGITALRQYLDELMAGRPNQPLRLLPVYRRLNEACGEKGAADSDLFFPDLTQRPPKRESSTNTLDEQAKQARLKAARLGFERGQSKWLKQDASGMRDMRNSIAMIEALQEQPAARAFWWVT
ncbi:MAG: Hpt domain-containing protein, partial [Georgfuchsia sp.]